MSFTELATEQSHLFSESLPQYANISGTEMVSMFVRHEHVGKEKVADTEHLGQPL